MMRRTLSIAGFLWVFACTAPSKPEVVNPEPPLQAPMPRAVQLHDEPAQQLISAESPAPKKNTIKETPKTAKEKPTFTEKEVRSVRVSEFKALRFDSQQTDINMPYRLFIPKGYEPSQPYALILYLHGAGDRGTDNERQFSQLTMWMARSKEQVEVPAFILAPQCPRGKQWVDTPWNDGSYSVDKTPISDPMKVVLEILDAVQTEYNIDPERILVTGVSMGGFGAWDLVSRFPDKFAAVMPVCGAGDPSKAKSIAHIPAWIFHGSKDTTVPTKGSREMVKALQDAGASPIYVEYKGEDHGIWNTAYKDDEALAWFFSQKKNPKK